eukprot:gene11180-12354_t
MNLDFLDNENSKEEDLYAIIGCDETSNIDQIKCEYKIRVLKVHPDKAEPDDKSAKESYDKLRYAYDILANEDSRRKYDTWRHCGLSISFKHWLSLRDASRTSMHWGKAPKKNLMLEHTNIEVKEGTSSTTINPVDTNTAVSTSQEAKNDIVNKKRNVLKRQSNGWGSSGISRKFKNYEI